MGRVAFPAVLELARGLVWDADAPELCTRGLSYPGRLDVSVLLGLDDYVVLDVVAENSCCRKRLMSALQICVEGRTNRWQIQSGDTSQP